MVAEVTGPRERYRAQMQAEIKQRAWEQIASTGVAALSLKAIAKQMGMSGPALYRYFAGRDDLITELIRDAYRSLADAVRQARDAGGDVAALAGVIREWALADPHRYFLIYGTPVPGYHAPDDTTAISSKIMNVLVEAYLDTPARPAPGALEADLGQHRHWAPDQSVPETALHQMLSFWTRVHGVLSLELAGHFTGMEFDPALLFEAEVQSLTTVSTTGSGFIQSS